MSRTSLTNTRVAAGWSPCLLFVLAPAAVVLHAPDPAHAQADSGFTLPTAGSSSNT